MSPPPPREIAPPEPEPLVATGNVLDTPLLTLPRVAPTPPAQGRPRPARAESEPRSDTTAATSTGTPGASPSAEPRPELRPVPSADVPAIDHQRVQATIDRVALLLGRIDQNKLSNDAKSNYAQAQKSVTNARRYLNERNLAAAADAADKASKLAQDLTGR
jgi:hypothetical protein